MKSKDYLKKYNLTDPNQILSDSDFFADLSSDYLATIEYLKESNQLNYSRFKTVSTEIFQKFESIRMQSKISYDWASLWANFNHRMIGDVEQKLFGDFLRKKAEKDRQNSYYTDFNGFKNFQRHQSLDDLDWAETIIKYLLELKRSFAPYEAFESLGLDEKANIIEVNKKFKEMAFKKHPDYGGKASDMIQLISARNQCLSYLQGK